MSGAPLTTDQLVGWVVVFLGGGAASKLIERVFKKKDDALREPAEMTRASAELSESLSQGSQDLLNEFRKEFKWLRSQVASLQGDVVAAKRESALATLACAEATAHRVRCEQDLEDVRLLCAQLQRQVDDLNNANQIDKMMDGKVATYQEIHRPLEKDKS